jgi:predicted DNA-binding protein YlxM (UPF0122 family)
MPNGEVVSGMQTALALVSQRHALATAELAMITAQRDSIIRAAYQAGMHLSEIADAASLHRSRVHQIVHREESDDAKDGDSR